ncbi:Asp-tRNA(Asn)/Glu-tRNA(Gln) amidotransferase subunit GatA [Candidatus Bandiella numerosa]|jgi:aspartyl-tRNA(Asn)/glutamyl-tRNA(Gln) amidotransferase subunit A|uniref:Asp-tRNA(Asn)/Glu-tRNA(Gln) amidotransferase subunit GatA n=1 Tax=Candidatus Bandiella numerosa TaxID=2570586 RepID=UPI00249DE9EF|nr:Asp-tRNA(Asn)/Glu-tRNA(Gln) amidotransferase subunit GatA [Candidatus Bandiella numerosa]WHA04989.1 Asp-tRNA(Asn)/Glu-tRNA(Gln) amidotransferase subunit GatA [Candidatus Bandiella numerosa]
MQELKGLPYYKIRQLLIDKKVSALELTNAYIETSREANKKYNAYREITDEYAINQAKASQERIDKGQALKIEAMPIGVKDNYCTKGVLTTACSRMLENFIPPYESTVTNQLFANGGIMIGKANMDEFAMGSSNTNSYFGNVINPYRASDSNRDLVAGGSSGGSAAAVAANMCLGALGSDTGGSVRLPAAFTGTVGVKPTYGRCSRFGMIAFASSLDQAGVFANNITDVGLIVEAISGFDENDSTSKDIASPDILNSIGKSIKGMKVGVPKEYQKENLNQTIVDYLEKAKQWFIDAGAEIVNISLPHTDHALATYYIITSAEASSNLARYDGVRYGTRIEGHGDNFQDMIERTRGECFGAEVKRRIISGTYVLSSSHFGAYYQKAQKVRRLIANDFVSAFEKVDVILTPTTSNPAFAIGEKSNPIDMYNNDLFTVPASLAGLPCMSIPIGFSHNKLPLGLQLIANSYDEENLFKFANIVEKSANFKR